MWKRNYNVMERSPAWLKLLRSAIIIKKNSRKVLVLLKTNSISLADEILGSTIESWFQ